MSTNISDPSLPPLVDRPPPSEIRLKKESLKQTTYRNVKDYQSKCIAEVALGNYEEHF